MTGFVWQAHQYEGFTVDLLEWLYAAGVEPISVDGHRATMDTKRAVEVYEFLDRLFTDKISRRSVATYMEEEARYVFERGDAVFMRNWPYAYALGNRTDSPVRGKIGIAPLPPFAGEGAQPAEVLGGLNYGISAYTQHPEEAWEALMCITSAEHQTLLWNVKNDLPTRESPYRDPALVKANPHMATLREALDHAYNRPTTPYYSEITHAISLYAHRVVTGDMSPEDAVRETNEAMQRALRGQAEV